MLPRFETLHRLRPVSLVAPASLDPAGSAVDLGAAGLADDRLLGDGVAAPASAPAVAVEVALGAEHPGRGRARPGRVEPAILLDGWRLAGWFEASSARTGLTLTPPTGAPVRLRSLRHGRVPGPAARVGLTLTGPWLTLLVHDGHAWTGHARADLRETTDPPDVHDPEVLAGLRVGLAHDGRATALRAGGFGQLGLRDVRFVTDADGTPLREGRRFWLTATHAGPGFADAAHAGVWLLDPEAGEVEHTADLFLRRRSPRRPDAAAGVHGDHAVHLVRDGDTWLLAASTWDELGPRPRHSPPPPGAVGTVLARTARDPRRGRRALDAEPLALPLGSETVGSWDPHLLRVGARDDGEPGEGDGGGWLVAFVEATAWFRFHPALAAGPDLDRLALRGSDPGCVATEGVTLARLGTGADGDEAVRLLVSDGPDARPPRRRAFTVLDLDLHPVGRLDADYPTNLPWPTLARDGDRWWLVTFDGTTYGGPLTGYGTHGDLVVARSAPTG